jgi:hypothetical protein
MLAQRLRDLAVLGLHLLVGLVGLGGVLAFQAGMLKAEDDRLHRRGMYRYLPPGL